MKINIFNVSLVSLFTLLFVVPFHYYWIKAPLFAIIVIGVLLSSRKQALGEWGQIRKGFPIIQLTYWYVFLGLFFILLGLQRAPENFLFYIGALYVVYPIVWGFLAYNFQKKHLVLIYKVLIFSTIFISIYTISYYLSRTGLSNWRLVGYVAELDLARNAGVKNGVAGVNLVSISTLIFSIPFLLTLISLPKMPKLVWNNRLINFGIFLLSMIAIIISGRRSAAIIILLAIPISFLFSLFLPKRERPRSTIYSIILISVIIVSLFLLSRFALGRLHIDPNSYIRYVATAVTETDVVRSPQREALIDGWSESPFLGSGHGVAADVVRDSTKPWRYEMSYFSLLFHTGILGFVGYSIGFIFIFMKGIRVIKQGGDDANLMVAQLTGLISMLIVYATNPYFDALDILWVIFLPVAFINTSPIEQSSPKQILDHFQTTSPHHFEG